MLVKKIEDVPAAQVQMEGAKNVTVRVLFGPDDNAPTFAMRLFEIDAGGHTPFHAHPYEHEVVVLEGEVILVSQSEEVPLEIGHVALVPPDEKHNFRNPSNSRPARMLCFVPVQYQK